MGYWTELNLRFLLSTKIKIKGRENIIQNEKFFIAASHQSMFETFYLQTIFNSPVFILKKELLLIPIFGWYLKKIGSISIKRNKVSKDNLSFFDDVKKIILNSKRPLIIFPQGTRVLPHERPSRKSCWNCLNKTPVHVDLSASTHEEIVDRFRIRQREAKALDMQMEIQQLMSYCFTSTTHPISVLMYDETYHCCLGCSSGTYCVETKHSPFKVKFTRTHSSENCSANAPTSLTWTILQDQAYGGDGATD